MPRIPDCLCHSLPGWRGQVKNSMACAPPGQSTVAAPPGPCPQPGIKPRCSSQIKGFLAEGKRKSRDCSHIPGGFQLFPAGGHSLAAPPPLLTHELWQVLALPCDAGDVPTKAFQRPGPLQALQGALESFVRGAQVPCGTTWTWQHSGLESEDMEQPQTKALGQ